MDVERLLAEFRSGARRLGPRGHGTRYSAALRRKAVEYLRARTATGVAVSAVASELGVGSGTLLRWAAEPAEGNGPAFVPVTVEAAPTAAGVVVHTAHGLRIEGLDVAALAELLRRLA